MADTPPPLTAKQQFRREYVRYVALPFFAFLLVFVVVMLGVFVLPQDGLNGLRASAVGNFFLVFLVLCPLAVLLIPVYLMLVAASFGIRKLHDGTERPLARLEERARNVHERVANFTENLNTRGVNWSVRLAPFMAWMDRFETPTQEKMTDDGQPTHTNN